MVKLEPDRLREIRSVDDALTFLAEELDWPIGQAELEEATFEFEPEELGIPAEQLPRLKQLLQLRPLTASQPWGIFFLEFTGVRLPVTALRRLLQALVRRKRAQSDVRTWHLNDLLFVTATDSQSGIELHLLAFFEGDDGRQPEIRSLPWNPDQSPPQHLARLADELLPGLEWPDDTSAADEWRAQWRGAFKLRHGEALRGAGALAERMASTATVLRELVEGALAREDGTFAGLRDDVRRELVADIDDGRFADMCAQTLVYGALSARVVDPEGFGASPVLTAIPLANPFLAAFFDQVQNELVAFSAEAASLDDLIADLRETNIEAILDQFGSTAKGGDPVIHFYEEFLAAYDRRLRADSGAFYTPLPIVQFMVRAVDELLRSEFRLPQGVADPTPWGEVAERVGFDVPEGVDPDDPFVSMLDPATGTGTFLVEWLRHARASFDGQADEWERHAREFVVASMHGFELMLAPYAIAHLKFALELEHQLGEPLSAPVQLTDSLDYPPAAEQFEALQGPVAAEGQRAGELKRGSRFTVVIGNPPYDREQRDPDEEGADGQRKGGVVRYGTGGIDPLLDDIIRPLREAGLAQHAKNVYNDYVYFWRWATWQATQRIPGPGITAFITASSYLDGNSFGGLRKHLRDRFDKLWIIDLGGEGRGAQTEENVFDIRTPVAIAIGVRVAGEGGRDVRYLRVAGNRAEKFRRLADLSLSDEEFAPVGGSDLAILTPRSAAQYHDWPQITQLFPWIHSGSQFKRTWPIGPSRELLRRRWHELCTSAEDEQPALLRETGFREITATPRPLLQPTADRLAAIRELGSDDEPEAYERYGYRSFDRQWAIADNRLADRPRPDLWRIRGPKQIFLTTLTSTRLGQGPALTATPYVPDLHHFRGSFGAKDVMPLWLDPGATDPNITAGLLEYLGAQLGIEVGAEDLASYVYAVLGTGAFADQFADELGEGAEPARVPVTTDPERFEAARALGHELLWLHTWGERFSTDELPPPTAAQIRPIGTYPVRFDYVRERQELAVGDGLFGPVSAEVWEFEVSGLRPLRSWLRYRMAGGGGRSSSPLDDIRPAEWCFTGELLRLLAIIERTVALTPRAMELLAEICGGDLLTSDQLPAPSDADRRPPGLPR